MPATLEKLDLEIADELAKFHHDPLGYAKFSYPWTEPGQLKDFAGPCPCQQKVLSVLGEEIRKRRFDGVHPVAPIRIAVSSGHGIGKSALVGMATGFIMSTRPRCQGTITANTYRQLETKTWAAIQKWNKLALNGHWFTVTADKIYKTEVRESWYAAAQTSSEENSEAFAGQHAAQSTSFYIFDEASAIPDAIFEVAEGGLTDGEPMILMFGNPTRNSGKFHRAVFGSERERWISIVIDSRECPLTNKAQIAEWIEDYGEDSDFVRVRVKGLPPRASDLQFIDLETVQAAKRREALTLPGEPLVMGIDVARGGMDSNVIRFRRGLDARTIPPVRIPGEQTRDTMRFIAKVSEIIDQSKPDAIFLDSTGIGGPIGDRLRQLGYKIIDVNFGAQSPDPKYANMRAYMWGRMKDWLVKGAIDDAKQDKNGRLEIDLTGPGYTHDRQSRVVLEPKEKMKDRGLDSPDDGDALALTFAMAVSAVKAKPRKPVAVTAWS